MDAPAATARRTSESAQAGLDRLGRVWLFRLPPPMACLTYATLAFLLAVCLGGPRLPVPTAHDEFSYLLAADTFAQGRLTNRSHPLAEHWETFHVLQRPSYQSKYLPGQAVLLAAGIVLCGHPIAGVWLGLWMAVAATTWCFHAWLPRRWANLGGLLIALHPMIQLEWGQSYLMGTLPMMAGALLFGCVGKLRTRPTVRLGMLLGFSAALLAVSRPYEGLAACLCVGGFLLYWFFRNCGERRAFAVRVYLPAALTTLSGLLALATYNHHVTGTPWTMPYQAYQQQYGYSPLFLWQSPQPLPAYNHEAMRSFYTGWEMEWYRRHFTLAGFWEIKWFGIQWFWLFFLGVPLTLPLMLLPRTAIHRRYRYAAIVVAGVWLASQCVPWCFPQYVACIVAPLFVLVAAGLRQLWYWQALRGPWLVTSCVLLFLVGTITSSAHHLTHPRDGWEWHRARLLHELTDKPGRHLVLVRYGSRHNVHEEWVYNRADMRAAKVIWLRERAARDLVALRTAFGDRQVWTVQADQSVPGLVAADGLLPRHGSVPVSEKQRPFDAHGS